MLPHPGGSTEEEHDMAEVTSGQDLTVLVLTKEEVRALGDLLFEATDDAEVLLYGILEALAPTEEGEL
jgi:hypothetical protein